MERSKIINDYFIGKCNLTLNQKHLIGFYEAPKDTWNRKEHFCI